MGNNTERDALRPAVIVSAATLMGFSSVFMFMFLINGLSSCTNWKDMAWFLGTFFILFGYFLFCGTLVIGLIEAAILGVIAYIIFKFLLPVKLPNKQVRILMILISIICAIIGLVSFSPADSFIRGLGSEKELIWKIDTNGDKRTDKWVYDDPVTSKLIKIGYDTNSDGKPDTWEYYKDGKVYKKEFKEGAIQK